MQWLVHVLGIDTQQSYYYDFWSGVGPVIFTQIPILISIIIHFKHKNCHVKGCWRIHTTIDTEHGWPACRIHHSKANVIGEAE